MKSLLMFLGILLTFLGCEKDLSPFIKCPDTSFPLLVGNRYRYHHVNEFMNNYFIREIVGDTLIKNKRYFIQNNIPFFNYIPFIRLEGEQMYAWLDWDHYEISYLNFKAQVGDESWYIPQEVGIVQNIKEKLVFGEEQKVWTIVPLSYSPRDSIIYSTKFGELAFYKNGKKELELVGAIICNKKYGSIQ